MAKRQRKNKPQKYIIQSGKLQHVTSARRFAVWVRAGLLEPIHSHCARVAQTAKTIWENGELFLAPLAQPTPSVKTNAEVVDSQYIYAHEGQVRITREERLRFADWRFRFGELADQMVSEYLSRQREFDMRAQYGW